jgi:hypothetical protein
VLALALDINNAGVISGRTATDPATGERYAFVATPNAQ